MFEDSRLRTFLTVVAEGSISNAARALHLTQPAVSHVISELEKEFGCRLFERGRSGVVLTEQGRLFKGCAEQIMHWYAVARDVLDNPDAEGGPARPGIIPLDADSAAEVWSSNGDIHIRIKKK